MAIRTGERTFAETITEIETVSSDERKRWNGRRFLAETYRRSTIRIRATAWLPSKRRTGEGSQAPSNRGSRSSTNASTPSRKSCDERSRP